jgi:hypothetical protein
MKTRIDSINEEGRRKNEGKAGGGEGVNPTREAS